MGLREVLLDQPDEPPGRIRRAIGSPMVQFVWFFGSLGALVFGVLWLVVALASPFEHSAWEYAYSAVCALPLLSWIAWSVAGGDGATETH